MGCRHALGNVMPSALHVCTPQDNNMMPLHFAAWKGHLEVVQALLKQETVRVNGLDNVRHTSGLMCAVPAASALQTLTLGALAVIVQ